MQNIYDVVVVGAGPAGLMAAKTAGENGLNVALLERKESITGSTVSPIPWFSVTGSENKCSQRQDEEPSEMQPRKTCRGFETGSFN